MSDQYTRIRCGGSALPADADVMGLLFGCDGVVYDSHEIQQTTTLVPQVALHQAVFPQHHVLGWYRVSNMTEPGSHDLQTTQQLQSIYAPGQPFLFAVLAVEEKEEEQITMEESKKQSQGNELPLTFFQLSDNALLALEGWELQTNPAERIALEHSVRSSEEQRSSLADLQHAYDMIQERLIVLEDYLSQEGPKDPEILRHIQSLFISAPVLTTAPSQATSVTNMMAQLATWTKMADALLSYTDKFKTVQDAPNRDHRVGLMSHS